MTDEELKTRIEFIANRLSFRIGDLTLMYEHKQVDPDTFYKEVNYINSDFVKSIMKLVREHEQSLECNEKSKKLDGHKGDVKK